MSEKLADLYFAPLRKKKVVISKMHTIQFNYCSLVFGTSKVFSILTFQLCINSLGRTEGLGGETGL